MKNKRFLKQKGITLIALVITIIILLILAGISISSLTDNGLFGKAEDADKQTEIAGIKEEIKLDIYEKQLTNLGSLSDLELQNILQEYGTVNYEDDGTIKGITTEKGYEIPISEIYSGNLEKVLLADGNWNSSKNVNSPKLMEGMTGVYWDENGTKTYVTAENQNNWYDYSKKEWANAETKDGSLWVWIPRYEYKITYTDTTDYSKGGTIDVKFIPTTQETVDSNYTYIHPAFQDGSEKGKNNNYANGEWDEEIPGFWVAKFPAGYAGGEKNDSNNDVIPVDSGETYSEIYEGIYNYYGKITSETTTMKYPVFMGQTYAYNYIHIGDSYKLAKSLIKTGNPYGLNKAETDSHQMKNSEWGAVAYLTHSQYGLDGQNSLNINNVNLGNTVSKIYAVTGYASDGIDTPENIFSTAPSSLEESISNGTYTSYAWYTENGQKGSSTQNITGVYDLSGCVWESISVQLENENKESVKNTHGGSLISETDLKYKMIYPHNSQSESNTENWNAYKNAQTETYGYGDAILETSIVGSGTVSWNQDYSSFAYGEHLSLKRGGRFSSGSKGGLFAYNHYSGQLATYQGFRAVLIGV